MNNKLCYDNVAVHTGAEGRCGVFDILHERPDDVQAGDFDEVSDKADALRLDHDAGGTLLADAGMRRLSHTEGGRRLC